MTDTTRREKYSVSVGVDRNLRAALEVAPEEGDNDVALVEHALPAGKLAAPLHRHTNEDEISYVLAERMGIREGREEYVIGAGEVAVKGRGIWHTFWNPGPGELRFLEVVRRVTSRGTSRRPTRFSPRPGNRTRKRSNSSRRSTTDTT